MDFLLFVGLGLAAGTLGGLLGIGGSVIMIPVLIFSIPTMSIHLAQAIAMSVNPAVAISSAAKHHKNKNVSWYVVKRVLPMSLLFIVLAAWFSNQIKGAWLEFTFAVFLIWVLWDQIKCIVGKSKTTPTNSNATMKQFVATGGITGTLAGLLGIGGGLIQVPLLNRLCKLPIKRAIGTSSAIMFVTAIVGATVKNVSLPSADQNVGESIKLAALIIPGALIGGWIGAKLTKVLPSKAIRIVFSVLVVVAGYKLFSGSIPLLF
ncbi:MAG: sulfite exporter TauE/SafE family protein [Planctomycetes bacterium]|nr:sulfite exporter TauE/SafE family protein [Planctomycetota bacterium]